MIGQVGYSHDQPPWHLKRTGFPAAWRMVAENRVKKPVRIAVADSGVDLRHAELWGLLGEGFNALRPGDPPTDENGHGTHVAGIIAAAAGAWQPGKNPPAIRLHPVKIFDKTGFGRMADIVTALTWCREQKVDIINLSFGTDLKSSLPLRQAILDAEQSGILLIGAAGNDGKRGAVDYPGRYPEVIAVAASTRQDRLAPYSSWGPEVDLIAPGSSVVSLAPGGGFIRMSGTSMAAPHVTAAAALALMTEPRLSARTIRTGLQETAEWLPTCTATAQGAGLLRADSLLRWVQNGRAPFWT